MQWAGRLRLAARVAAAAVLVVAGGTLALQAAGVLAVAQTSPFGPLTIAPSTAAALAIGAVALWLRTSRARHAAAAADVAAAAMVALTVAGMFAHSVGVMRPAYNTLAALLLLAGALASMERSRSPRWPLFQWLAIAGGVIALFAAAGYVYGSPHLYHAVERSWGMAAPTAAALIVLAVGDLVRAARARADAAVDARRCARPDAATGAAGAVRGAAVRVRAEPPGAQRGELAADAGGAARRRRHARRRMAHVAVREPVGARGGGAGAAAAGRRQQLGSDRRHPS
ncbi:MAG TPA: hypothetical protein VF334_22085 [Polyangia bacterium]